MRQKFIVKIVSEIKIFETVAKYDGGLPSKIETKTNILCTNFETVAHSVASPAKFCVRFSPLGTEMPH